MARPSGPKTRCSGNWTEAKYRSFIKNQLRSASRKWGPIHEVKKEANISRGVYECAQCKQHIPPTLLALKGGRRKRVNNIFVDHVNPIVPISGFTTWDEIIDRMFSEKDNLQLLCGPCHDIKTAEETKQRVKSKVDVRNHPREYNSWKAMRARCQHTNHEAYERYGGAGITVDPVWSESFWDFLSDMGPRPDGTTLDREDNTKGYYKENCRWSTPEVQANNRKDNRRVIYEEEDLTISQWSKKLGIPTSTLLNRLNREWTIGQALGFVEKVNGKRALTDAQVVHAQALRSSGTKLDDIAEFMGVSRSVIVKRTKPNKNKEEENG